jgi:hypothetical protein
MRKTITLIASVIAIPLGLAAPAQAERTTCENRSLKKNYSAHYYAVAGEHGKRAPGRNIRKWGLTKTKQSKCRHLRKSLRTLRRMRHPGSQLLSAGRPYVAPAGTASLRATGAPLASIRACESGGNYGAISPGGTYRGAYQFDYQTWQSVGGSGDPAAASPAEQDRRAAILYSQRGAQPWPVCGR